jgi:hypothetical protein
MLKRKAEVLYLRPTWSFKKESLSLVLEAHLAILKEKKSPSPVLSPLDHFEKKKFKSHSWGHP